MRVQVCVCAYVVRVCAYVMRWVPRIRFASVCNAHGPQHLRLP
jgi:hypothetical protein